MAETATQRLRTYLAALPPGARALLTREFERSVATGGDNAAVAAYVLGELRRMAPSGDAVASPVAVAPLDPRPALKSEPRREPPSEVVSDAPPIVAAPQIDDPMRLVFRPLDPFLTDVPVQRPGLIRRSLLLQVWQWLRRDGAPAATERLLAALAATADPARSADRGFAISDFQRAAAIALSTAASALPADQKVLLARIGPTVQPEDLALIADLLRARDALDALALRLPSQVRDFGPPQVTAFEAALNTPALMAKSVIPFALVIAMRRLPMAWQIVRLATRAADSDSEYRVASTPFAIAVTMAIQDLAGIAAHLREDLRAARFKEVAAHLKALHDGVRGLLAEIDIRQDSAWGRQIAALRADISNALRAQIEALPGRVRRLLRQRPSTDITPATRLDAADIDETVALIEMVETCRGYAEELAVNEVTNRTRADLTQYVGPTTDAAIAALRGCDARTLPFRRQQADAAIAFSRVLFGAEHAALMRRSAEKAISQEPQAKSA